eukprot:TRINITY_DN9065_c0_g1_i1.p1 TRINITY_DN9065_c0_g1~~TRINITY_DN9065_c0_g1_i1.p1  ORF type:complete len:611 (-),score=122.83 TRINITY_DN9065_c0_g1_i1:147-1940(-)
MQTKNGTTPTGGGSGGRDDRGDDDGGDSDQDILVDGGVAYDVEETMVEVCDVVDADADAPDYGIRDRQVRETVLEKDQAAPHEGVAYDVEASGRDDETTMTMPTPVPWRKLFVIGSLMMADSLSLAMLWPFVTLMVKSFNMVDDEKKIGYYAGFIAGSWFIAQFVSSFVWGTLSDYIGRRPVLLFGMLGNTVLSSLFGTSQNLFQAILWRTLAGLANGNLGVGKGYIREITDESNQARAWSFLSLSYGAGVVVGPIIGGFFSEPARLYPNLVPEDSLFGRYPYLLPCLISSFFTFMGMIAGYFVLEESLKNPWRPWKKQSNKEEVKQYEMLEIQKKASVECSDTTMDVNINEKINESEDKSVKSFLVFIWTSKLVRITITLYLLHAFSQTMYDELYSMWAIQSIEDGGIAFDNSKIGLAMTISGIFFVIGQLIIYPPLDKKYGTLMMWRITTMLTIPPIILTPALNFLASSPGWVLWIGVCLVTLLRLALSELAFCAVLTLINNACYRNAGGVNGLSTDRIRFGWPDASCVSHSWWIDLLRDCHEWTRVSIQLLLRVHRDEPDRVGRIRALLHPRAGHQQTAASTTTNIEATPRPAS